jgi:hypothetical protein
MPQSSPDGWQHPLQQLSKRGHAVFGPQASAPVEQRGGGGGGQMIPPGKQVPLQQWAAPLHGWIASQVNLQSSPAGWQQPLQQPSPNGHWPPAPHAGPCVHVTPRHAAAAGWQQPLQQLSPTGHAPLGPHAGPPLAQRLWQSSPDGWQHPLQQLSLNGQSPFGPQARPATQTPSGSSVAPLSSGGAVHPPGINRRKSEQTRNAPNTRAMVPSKRPGLSPGS